MASSDDREPALVDRAAEDRAPGDGIEVHGGRSKATSAPKRLASVETASVTASGTSPPKAARVKPPAKLGVRSRMPSSMPSVRAAQRSRPSAANGSAPRAVAEAQLADLRARLGARDRADVPVEVPNRAGVGVEAEGHAAPGLGREPRADLEVAGGGPAAGQVDSALSDDRELDRAGLAAPSGTKRRFLPALGQCGSGQTPAKRSSGTGAVRAAEPDAATAFGTAWPRSPSRTGASPISMTA